MLNFNQSYAIIKRNEFMFIFIISQTLTVYEWSVIISDTLTSAYLRCNTHKSKPVGQRLL